MEAEGRIDESRESRDFEELLRRHARSMLQYADFVLHDLSAAEDASQEAFVVAWRRRNTLRDTAAFRPWLRRIVLRECLRWRRQPWLRVLNLTDRVASRVTEPNPAQSIDIEQAMKKLAPRLRAVIFLHFFEDLPLKAVAAELNIPEGTVKTRLYEALRRLGPALPGYAIGGEEPRP